MKLLSKSGVWGMLLTYLHPEQQWLSPSICFRSAFSPEVGVSSGVLYFSFFFLNNFEGLLEISLFYVYQNPLQVKLPCLMSVFRTGRISLQNRPDASITNLIYPLDQLLSLLL